MHFGVTNSQLLAGVFSLTLGIIFALATVVQFRLQRARPFRNDSSPETDPPLLLNESFTQPEDIPANESASITDFGARYSHSPNRRAIALDRDRSERE
jgi:hypothetical protein